jgi:hypothetical protein
MPRALTWKCVRWILHLGLVASLLLAFGQAPFNHTHDSDPHHDHAEGIVHAHKHWQGHAPVGPGWEDRDYDSDARSRDWFAGDGRSPVRFVATLPETVVVTAPAVLTCSLIAELIPRNHDPPWLINLKSRAPPA